MKNLGNLSPQEGSHKKQSRIGRGPGSGNGKTAGKGHKGQKARKGGGVAPGFEGGQTPLYRRLPKYGFSNKAFETSYQIINVGSLSCFADGDEVNLETLKNKGLLKSNRVPVKILGKGELKVKLKLQLKKISQGARQAVLNAGGTIEEK